MKPINRLIRRWRLWRLRRAVLSARAVWSGTHRIGPQRTVRRRLQDLAMSAVLDGDVLFLSSVKTALPEMQVERWGDDARTLRQCERAIHRIDAAWRAYVRSLRYLAGGR